MAAPTEFNLNNNQKAERKLLVTAVNVGTGDAKEWEIVGAGVEESAIELNPDIATLTDILGVTETTVNKTEPKQTVEPYTVRGGSKLAFKLYDITRRNALSEYSQFEVMLIHGYVGEAGSYQAEIHGDSTILVTSIGGSANVDMPIEINFSNKKTLGTVNSLKAPITFTADTAA